MDAKKISAIAQAFQDVEECSDGNTSVKHKFLGEQLQLTYTTLVFFAEERSLRLQVLREFERSSSIVDSCIKKASESFKDLYGKSMKLKISSDSDNVEIISSTANSPRKIAYYRRYFTYEVG